METKEINEQNIMTEIDHCQHELIIILGLFKRIENDNATTSFRIKRINSRFIHTMEQYESIIYYLIKEKRSMKVVQKKILECMVLNSEILEEKMRIFFLPYLQRLGLK